MSFDEARSMGTVPLKSATGIATNQTLKARFPRVRTAKPDDLDGLVDLFRSLHEKATPHRPRLNEDRVRSSLTRAMQNPYSQIVVIDDGGGRIEGATALHFSMPWFSDQAVVEIVWLSVLNDVRHGPGAGELIAFAKALIEGEDVCVQATAYTPEQVDLFRTELGEPCGTHFRCSRSGEVH